MRRVRSERRASSEAQRRALAAQCKRHGWQLLEALEPAGLSAKDLQAGIQDTQRVRERADAQALVAAKRDLPSRVLTDLASLMASAQKRGFALVALDCSLEALRPRPAGAAPMKSRRWSAGSARTTRPMWASSTTSTRGLARTAQPF